MNEIKDMTNIEIVGFKEYQLKTVIKALQMKRKFKVKTHSDGWSYGEIGDWLCENKNKDRFIISNELFKMDYGPVKEPNEYEIESIIMDEV